MSAEEDVKAKYIGQSGTYININISRKRYLIS
jgi:hypothetical protein